ncbi:MAG TPA: TolC family protein [Ignavibacteria bacterium]|nr:TolC family protein [Ignavibacteria bacterium]
MKKKSVLFLLLFIILISKSNISLSQENITLNQAVSTAIQNNTAVSNLEKNLQVQKLSTKTAKGNLFPDLFMNAGWSRNNTYSGGTVTFQNGIPIQIPEQDSWINNFGLGLNSQVVLFNGFSNYEQIDIAKENEGSVEININKEKYDIAYRVTVAYFDVLKNERIVKANQDNLADSQLQLDKIKEYMNVGKRTIADVYKQDVLVAQNELTLERSINEYNKSKVSLLFAMNAEINKEFTVSDDNINIDITDAELQTIINKNANTESLLNIAKENRYDYKSTLQDIRINQVQYSIDKKNMYFPTISAFLSYNLNASRIEDVGNSRNFSFGLNLNYPIFQGFKLTNKSQASEISIKQKQDDLNQLQQQIRSDLKKSYLDIQTAGKQIEIIDRNIKSAEQDKLLSEENYKVGLGTLLDVQTASTKLNLLIIDKIKAYYDFLLAEKKLNYYTGDLSY